MYLSFLLSPEFLEDSPFWLKMKLSDPTALLSSGSTLGDNESAAGVMTEINGDWTFDFRHGDAPLEDKLVQDPNLLSGVGILEESALALWMVPDSLPGKKNSFN